MTFGRGLVYNNVIHYIRYLHINSVGGVLI